MLSGLKSKYDQRHLERIYREIRKYGGELKETAVTCYNISKLLEQHSFKVIDFLSLNIEGGELDVLKTIDFEIFSFNAIAVENNYGENHIKDFLKTKGFKKMTNLSGDDIYIKKIGFLASFKSLFRSNKN